MLTHGSELLPRRICRHGSMRWFLASGKTEIKSPETFRTPNRVYTIHFRIPVLFRTERIAGSISLFYRAPLCVTPIPCAMEWRSGVASQESRSLQINNPEDIANRILSPSVRIMTRSARKRRKAAVLLMIVSIYGGCGIAERTTRLDV